MKSRKRRILYAEIGNTHDPRRDFVIALIQDYPRSHSTILRIIRGHFECDNANEWRFTLFCFLDNLKWVRLHKRELVEILDALEDYLLHVQTSAAFAAWMAADLLGAHWHRSQAVPILLRVLQQGKYAAGRCACIHGLEAVVKRLYPGSAKLNSRKVKLLGQIIEHLRLAEKSDRSPRVRSWCRIALQDIPNLTDDRNGRKQR